MDKIIPFFSKIDGATMVDGPDELLPKKKRRAPANSVNQNQFEAGVADVAALHVDAPDGNGSELNDELIAVCIVVI